MSEVSGMRHLGIASKHAGLGTQVGVGVGSMLHPPRCPMYTLGGDRRDGEDGCKQYSDPNNGSVDIFPFVPLA